MSLFYQIIRSNEMIVPRKSATVILGAVLPLIVKIRKEAWNCYKNGNEEQPISDIDLLLNLRLILYVVIYKGVDEQWLV